MLTRRQALAGTAALAMTSRSALAAAPLRIGMLSVKSGALAAGGRQMEDGFRLFLRERGNRIAGREVEFIVADTGGQPALAKTRAQELVQRSGVHVVVGPVAAFEALAISDYLQEAGVPFLCASAAAEDLTQRRLNPWFVRTSSTSAQPCHPLGEYAARDLGYKRIIAIADDFAFGQEQTSGFQRAFEAAGGNHPEQALGAAERRRLRLLHRPDQRYRCRLRRLRRRQRPALPATIRRVRPEAEDPDCRSDDHGG